MTFFDLHTTRSVDYRVCDIEANPYKGLATLS